MQALGRLRNRVLVCIMTLTGNLLGRIHGSNSKRSPHRKHTMGRRIQQQPIPTMRTINSTLISITTITNSISNHQARQQQRPFLNSNMQDTSMTTTMLIHSTQLPQLMVLMIIHNMAQLHPQQLQLQVHRIMLTIITTMVRHRHHHLRNNQTQGKYKKGRRWMHG